MFAAVIQLYWIAAFFLERGKENGLIPLPIKT
jgi:hypothetical protein